MKGYVYLIQNKINNKCYVGSTILDIRRRKNHHFHHLRNNKHRNKYLQNSWNKYGEENFEFVIFKECKREDTLKWELFFILCFNSFYDQKGYNIHLPIENNRGIPCSETAKEKISEKLKGRYLTEETKIKISISLKNKKKPKGFGSHLHKSILQYDVEGNFIKEWDSVRSAAKALNLLESGISLVLNNKLKKTGKKYIFKYKTNEQVKD